MSIINIDIDKDKLEILRQYFLYVVIIVLSTTNYNTFMLYKSEVDKRLEDNKEALKTYQDGYYQTNNLLQKFLRNEKPNNTIDTNDVLYRK